MNKILSTVILTSNDNHIPLPKTLQGVKAVKLELLNYSGISSALNIIQLRSPTLTSTDKNTGDLVWAQAYPIPTFNNQIPSKKLYFAQKDIIAIDFYLRGIVFAPGGFISYLVTFYY